MRRQQRLQRVLAIALRRLQLLEAPHDVAVLAPLLQREIFYRVLTGPLGTRLRARAQADRLASRMARAIELLRQPNPELLGKAGTDAAMGRRHGPRPDG